MTADPKPVPLRQFFEGLAEYAFESRLGVADPPLIDYVADMLARFIQMEAVYKLRHPAGRRLDEVTDMLAEAQLRVGTAKREIHRHIGDFTLFWTGVYPESLPRLRSAKRKDYMVDYCAGQTGVPDRQHDPGRRPIAGRRSAGAIEPRLRRLRPGAGRSPARMGASRTGRRLADRLAQLKPGRSRRAPRQVCSSRTAVSWR